MTLADRLIEYRGGLEAREMAEQPPVELSNTRLSVRSERALVNARTNGVE